MSSRQKESGKSDPKSSRMLISQTAMITLEAYATGGIPMAREFLSLIRQDRPNQESWITPKGDRSIKPEMALILRARYLGADTIARTLIQAGMASIFIERAAGLYPFGFNITADCPVTYIETDISEDFKSKPWLCAKISSAPWLVPNVHKGRHIFTAMDAITLNGIKRVSQMLKGRSGDLCIIDAGLMIYQTEKGFTEYVDAGKRLLKIKRGGTWIATDIAIRNREFIERMIECGPDFEAYFKNLKDKLGVDYKKFFPNRQKLLEFLDGKGLEVRGYTPAELGYELSFDGLEKSTMPLSQLESYMGYLDKNFMTTVLRLRKQ